MAKVSRDRPRRWDSLGDPQGPTGDDPVRYGVTVTRDEITPERLPGVRLPGPAALEWYSAAPRWMVVGGAGKPYTLVPVGVWIGSRTKVRDPYPCDCNEPRSATRCRRRSCRCFGLPLHDDLPPWCCRYDPEGMRLAAWEPGQDDVARTTPAGPVVAQLRREQEEGPLSERTAYALREIEPNQLRTDEDLAAWLAMAKVRLIEAGAHCPCPTPWDGQKGVIAGHHCAGCHTNWASLGLAAMHHKSWLEPCIDPLTIRDVSTGHPLLRLTVINRLPVWVSRPLTAEDERPGYKYE